MEIIRAYSRHLSLILGLFDQYRQLCGQTSDLEGGRVFLAERLERRDSVIFFASEGSGSFERALGFVQIYPGWSSQQLKRIWFLSDLYVQPESRRRGIARGLHERARQHALETKAYAMVFDSAGAGETARHLTESLGYRLEAAAGQFLLELGT